VTIGLLDKFEREFLAKQIIELGEPYGKVVLHRGKSTNVIRSLLTGGSGP